MEQQINANIQAQNKAPVAPVATQAGIAGAGYVGTGKSSAILPSQTPSLGTNKAVTPNAVLPNNTPFRPT